MNSSNAFRLSRGDAILDVGCGTGSLAILLKQAAPDTRIVGLDPDAEALTIARRKARAAGVEIEWCQGFAQDAASFGSFDKVVSSLVFHQVPLAGKRSGIAAMFAAVKTGGLVCIADYALQSSWLMRQLFRFIQMIDNQAVGGSSNGVDWIGVNSESCVGGSRTSRIFRRAGISPPFRAWSANAWSCAISFSPPSPAVPDLSTSCGSTASASASSACWVSSIVDPAPCGAATPAVPWDSSITHIIVMANNRSIAAPLASGVRADKAVSERPA